MTETSRIDAIEKFITTNSQFYNKCHLHIYSVSLRLIRGKSRAFPWAIQFDYDMLRGKYFNENKFEYYPNGEAIEQSFHEYLNKFFHYTGYGTLSLLDRPLKELQNIFEKVKIEFITNTKYKITAFDKISDNIINAEKEEKQRRDEFLDNNFPFDKWCSKFIKKNIAQPDNINTLDYNEKLLENFIRDHPFDFLGEELILLSQQEILEGFRPDLIFKTTSGEILIVEIQLNALDRNHLYKSLEYRDLYTLKHNVQNVNVLLVCNELPDKYKRILENHKVDCKCISKKDFISKIKNLKPRLKISNRPKSKISIKLTCEWIGNKVKLPGNNEFDIDAQAFYAFPCLETTSRSSKSLYYDLSYFEKIGKKYRNIHDFYGFGDIDISTPIEIIIESNSLLTLKSDFLYTAKSWIKQIVRYADRGNYIDHEIILGYRGFIDYCNYESYIQGSIKIFEPLWRLYGEDDYSYNKEKIEEDLKILSEISFFTNKYPNYILSNLFESFEVLDGAGHLDKRERLSFHEQIKDYKWLTIKLKKVDTGILNMLDEFIDHLDIGHYKSYHSNCPFCVIPPVKFEAIAEDSLILTSAYFQHIKKTK